jgi:hypothetical protein
MYTNLVIHTAAKCSFALEDLYKLYGVLSRAIHGKPWSGPKININTSELEQNQICMIEKLSNEISFQVEKKDDRPVIK